MIFPVVRERGRSSIMKLLSKQKETDVPCSARDFSQMEDANKDKYTNHSYPRKPTAGVTVLMDWA